MRRTNRLYLLTLTAAVAFGLAFTSASASASTTSGSPADTDGTALVGSGTIDVSELTIVGVIDPTTGEVTDVTPYHPEPVAAAPSEVSGGNGGVVAQITHPACAGRTDFYRLISSSGTQQCFANSGTYTLSSGYWVQTQYLCPGNNQGRTKYVAGSYNYWSVWRGPESNYNTCYAFNTPVAAFAVQIA